MQRIDKLVVAAMGITRAQARAVIKKGGITVNGACVKSAGFKADECADDICLDGKRLEYKKFVYIMMNKPEGVISASDGKNEKTVIDLLPPDMTRKNLFPAGRLDKGTTGFVLITDDGAYAHRILSPKNHISKTYEAVLDKPFGDDLISDFKTGVDLGDCVCMPATLEALNSERTHALVVIRQGMYHQIKRMFKSRGITVKKLNRIKMGNLALDPLLKPGECRYMTAAEIQLVENG